MSIDTTTGYSLTLFTAQSGAPSARLDHADGTSRHLHSLVEPEKEAEYFRGLQFWGDRIVLVGCGLGYHLRDAIASVNRAMPVLVVEYYRELADRVPELFPENMRGAITIITSASSTPRERAAVFMREGGRVQFVRHPASYHAHPDFYQRVLAPPTPLVRSRNRPSSLLLMQGDFFVERELAAAATAGGRRLSVFRYKEHQTADGYESHLQEVLQTEHPDVILSINMLGFDGNGILAEYAARAGIPVAVWFVDDPQPILLNHRAAFTRDMVAFTWERSTMPWLQQQGFGSVHYLPLAGDPARLAPVTIGSGAPIRCGFVGTSMGREFLDDIAGKFIWRPEYTELSMRTATRLLQAPASDVAQLLIEERKSMNLGVAAGDLHTDTWLRSYIIHFASMLKRKKVVSGLLSCGIETFGDPAGWRELCGDALPVHGNLDYHRELAGCYRSIAININITSCQMPAALNQRVFDVPLCGAFVLNDHQADLETLFAPHEYASCTTPEEYPDKVAFYCDHPEIRETIITAARRRILAEHTYLHRLDALISVL
jgi:spore maturation protein CgeB